MTAREINIDGLVGPSHNYTGLSFGNIASETHAFSVSHPKQAALQGLKKMKFLHDLGIPQLVMPPHLRPHTHMMHRLGYHSLDAVPDALLPQLYSASSMWVANAATISPSVDTRDGKVHITPANLVSKFHRSLEYPVTASYLKQMFCGDVFVHHEALPPQSQYADEGAANHMRLSALHGEKGMNVFVYGTSSHKYPARQSRLASEAIARLHGLDEASTIYLLQSANAIDKGVFHNDVIAMSNESLLIYHEAAYDFALPKELEAIQAIAISSAELSVEEAVSTYLFNSQLVTLPDGKIALIAPEECAESKKVQTILTKLLAQNILSQVYYLNVRESMKNGGGPACLRLRAVLTEQELGQVNPSVILTEKLYSVLCQWIEHHYRDKLQLDDLRDPLFPQEMERASDALSAIFNIEMRNV